MKRFFVIFILFSCALSRLEAQDFDSETLPWEKGSLQLGGLLATFHSELTFGIKGGRNGSINGEDLLGLDSTLGVFRADAFYRPGKRRRSQFDFTYASYDRDGSVTLSRELTIGSKTYPVGARVETLLNFDISRGTYSYAVVQNERVRVALGLGVYVVPLRYGLKVQTQSAHSVVEGADATVPLPELALRTEVRLYSKL